MGIDYLVYKECEQGFPDVNDYKPCECGLNYCGEKCAVAGGLQQVLDEDGYFGGVSDCKYCRREEFDDSELLDFVLKRENISRDDLISLYQKEK